MDEAKLFIPVNKIQYIETTTINGVNLEGRFNSRSLDNPGFETAKINKLRMDIQEQGLDSPLLIRRLNDHYGLVAGERRLRCIQMLVESNVKCFDPITKHILPASKIYIERGVECKIKEFADEKEYLKANISENVLHEPLTDYDLLMQLVRMEEAGMTREEQAKVMDLSIAWISQSHSIIDSHHRILQFMKEGKLSRTAAITFISVPKEKIDQVLDRAIALNYAEAENKLREGIEERNIALDDVEKGEIELSIANFTDDRELTRKSRKSIADAGRKLRSAQKKIESAQDPEQMITDPIVLDACREIEGASNKIRRTRTVKEIRHSKEKLEEQIKEGNVIDCNGESVPEDKINVILQTMNWVLNFNDPRDPWDNI